MIRQYQTKDDKIHGDLVIDECSSEEQIAVSYIPPPLWLDACGFSPDDAESLSTRLLEFDTVSGRFTIYPIRTIPPRETFLKPKYRKIRKITLSNDDNSELVRDYARSITFRRTQPFTGDEDEIDITDFTESADHIIDILESLPPAFIKDYDYGLGLAKPYRFIVEAVEELTDCTEIAISADERTNVDDAGEIFHIATDDFETIRKMLNSTTNMNQVAARVVKSAETYNFFAEILGRKQIPVKIGRHRLRKLFTRALLRDDTNLSSQEQEQVIGVITRNIKSLSKSKPENIARLRNDIELVSLESLTTRYRAMLASKHAEKVWQRFFDENPFILTLAFGYPIIKVGQHASVGGRRLTGRGEKITDFLMKNSMTNNTAVVEIKTPDSSLIKNSQFRGGVFAPSTILSESTIQALDQKYQFQRDISGIKDRSREHDIESYSVQCCLVIGTMPQTDEQKKSFELFRGNSKDVQIVTFDELLEKLVQLGDVLASTEDEEEGILPGIDPPC